MTREQVLRYVQRLNDPSEKDVLGIEWELAVVSAFSRLGTVQYEPTLSGSAHPDIVFKPRQCGDSVAIDITTISDKGLHERNPYHRLLGELEKRAEHLETLGATGGFFVRVEADRSGIWRGRPLTLRLPRIRDFGIIFNADFDHFLQKIIAEPRAVHVFELEIPEAHLGISFDPRQRGVNGTHATYNLAYSKIQNPLSRALNSKIRQLKRSGFDGPLGIVVCDGDCYMLRSRWADWRLGDSYSSRDVVQHYFDSHASLSFVLILAIDWQQALGRPLGTGNLEYQSKLLLNPGARNRVSNSVIEILQGIPKLFPIPMRTAYNARSFLDWQKRTKNWFGYGAIEGGLVMTDKTVKVSARAILDLLSGQKTGQEFSRLHRLDDFNPFQVMRGEGRLLKSVRVEESEVPEDDDEWIVFEFGEQDPAMSPFKSPDAHLR